jgi:hypothetical protein
MRILAGPCLLIFCLIDRNIAGAIGPVEGVENNPRMAIDGGCHRGVDAGRVWTAGGPTLPDGRAF